MRPGSEIRRWDPEAEFADETRRWDRMDMEERFDLVVIGSGPGGYTAAIQAAKAGMRVAVVEKEEIGGTYTNKGCLPVKAMLYSAVLYEELCQCEQFGLHADHVGLDFKKVKEYRDQAAASYREKICRDFAEWHVVCFHGEAKIHREHLVSVHGADGGEPLMLHGERILVAVGAKPAMPQVPGMDLPGVSTSYRMLQEDSWDFKSVIVIGGGIVGTEFAAIFQIMGIRVILMERAGYLIPAMDEDISQRIRDSMEEQGMEVHTGVLITGVSRDGEQDGGELTCAFREKGVSREVRAERILVAAGRQACLEKLFEESLLPELKRKQGAPVVGADFQTSIPGIYAVGDVLQRIQLAHPAAAQATYLVESLSGRQPSLLLSCVPAGMYVNLPIVPACIYTRPEIASVGLTESMARRAGCQVCCGVYTMEDNGQAIISHQNQGIIKLVFALPGKILIGAHMICPRATDMIGEMATAIANGLTARKLMLAMRAYPTYGEGIAKATENSGLLS